MIVDGGRGQLSAAFEVLEALDLVALPIAALAKQFEELYVPGEDLPIVLPRNSPALHLVQHVRDEAHRFAIAYHRGLRGKALVSSALDAIPGVGPARRKALIRAFGSASGVRRASIEELVSVPGITPKLAGAIKEVLAQMM